MAFKTTKSKFVVNESASDWLNNLGWPRLKSLHCKRHERENGISEDHWTWPKYSKENNDGEAQVEDGQIVF